MNAFHSAIPPKSKEFENQTELSPITDDDYRTLSRPFHFTGVITLYQILSFILIQGAFRVLFSIIITLFTFSVILLARVFLRALGMPTKCRGPCLSIARFGARCLLFFCGITFIQIEGNCDPTARFIVGNHVCALDMFLIFSLLDCTSPIDLYYKSYHLLDLLLESLRPVWIDTTRPAAYRKTICDWVDNFKRPPILMFPEGCGKDVIMRFRDTAFSTPYRVQPFTIRYHMFGVPKGWNTYAYRGEGVLSVLWRLFAMPPSYVSLHFLPSISMAADGKADLQGGEISIERFLVSAQLLLANDLGVQAVDHRPAD
jgi:1-acyl-sn-glycerol-3-phosphate acyltransferase